MNTDGVQIGEWDGGKDRAWDVVGEVGDEERATETRNGGGAKLVVRVQVMRSITSRLPS